MADECYRNVGLRYTLACTKNPGRDYTVRVSCRDCKCVE